MEVFYPDDAMSGVIVRTDDKNEDFYSRAAFIAAYGEENLPEPSV